MTTSKPTKAEKQMLSVVDFLANRSRLQANKKPPMTTDISGPKCLELLKKLNLNGSLGKMSETLLASQKAWYSNKRVLTWKAKVTKSKRLVFQLQVSMPRIKDTECGLSDTNLQMYPTATASNSMEINMPVEYISENSQGYTCTRKGTGTKFGAKLNDVVRYLETKNTWSTPTAFDANTIRKPRKKSSGGQKPPLSQEVLMYPTPLSRDYKDTLNQKPSKKQKKLIDAVREQMWPTPTANEDACGKPTGKMQKMLGNHPDVRSQGSGTLNPMWVEWLMGYPIGWTDLKD